MHELFPSSRLYVRPLRALFIATLIHNYGPWERKPAESARIEKYLLS